MGGLSIGVLARWGSAAVALGAPVLVAGPGGLRLLRKVRTENHRPYYRVTDGSDPSSPPHCAPGALRGRRGLATEYRRRRAAGQNSGGIPGIICCSKLTLALPAICTWSLVPAYRRHQLQAAAFHSLYRCSPQHLDNIWMIIRKRYRGVDIVVTRQENNTWRARAGYLWISLTYSTAEDAFKEARVYVDQGYIRPPAIGL